MNWLWFSVACIALIIGLILGIYFGVDALARRAEKRASEQKYFVENGQLQKGVPDEIR